jgi:pyrimidine-nucleoside phosphorylase
LLGYLEGTVEGYQISAFLMAVYFKGMSSEELTALVDVMLHSGQVLDLSYLPSARVDKHSTGGVGDKVSLPLAPLVAEAGIYVPMMSGQGLGHTGGTLDKLASIPGFRTDLSIDRFREVLGLARVAMIGQTPEIAPLDGRLYALRSVTGTVPSIPLIAASIMSKKLAEGLTGLVLDVKAGSGAFLTDLEASESLAQTMVEIGHSHGVETVACMTAMDRPLGKTIGNALEVRESLEILRGEGPADTRDVVLGLAAEMLALGGAAADPVEGRARATALLDSGRPLERFQQLISLQGGDPRVVDDPDGHLPVAPARAEARAARDGIVTAVHPRPLGRLVVELGGGRLRLTDSVDLSVGIDRLVSPGTEVRRGDLLGRIHARNAAGLEQGLQALQAAVEIGEPGAPVTLLPQWGRRIVASLPS